MGIVMKTTCPSEIYRDTQADSRSLFRRKKNFFFCRQETLWCVLCKRPARWGPSDLKNYRQQLLMA